MEERNIKISLEKAKEWYNSDNHVLIELALQAFRKNELKDEPNYPKSIKEFCKKHPDFDGYFIDSTNDIISIDYNKNEYLNNACLDAICSKEEAIAIQTLITLRLIRKVSYVKDWERDFKSDTWCVDYTTEDKWAVIEYSSGTSLFSFPTEEMAYEFLINFKDEFEKIEPLYK